MKRAYKYLIFIIVIAIAVGIVLSVNLFNKPKIDGKVTHEVTNTNIQNSNVSQVYEPIKITKENLPSFLSNQQIVKDIPEKGKFLLKLYNFNSGERQIEETYVISKANVEKASSESYDAIIYLDSKYVSQLSDFCNAISTAKKNNELGYESKISELAFMWKYKGMLKYKSCFGL